MSIGQRWPEVVDPPSFWRAEMPKCEVIFALALRALEAEEKPRDLILGLPAFPTPDEKLLPSKNDTQLLDARNWMLNQGLSSIKNPGTSIKSFYV